MRQAAQKVAPDFALLSPLLDIRGDYTTLPAEEQTDP
jgi:hypothetical protein